MESDELQPRAVICAGAGGGIGAEVAQLLAAAGARVLVADIDLAAADRTARGIRDSGGVAVAAGVQIADPASCEAMVTAAVQEFGFVDGLYNGVGVADPTLPIHEQSIETWQRLVAINVLGSAFAIRAVTPHLIASGNGVIVNVSSGAGLRATDAGHAPYTTSKHAVIGLTKAAAVDLAPYGIRVNVIAPGPTLTSMVKRYLAERPEAAQHMKQRILLGRLAEPHEIAAMAFYLFSRRSSFCTGSVYEVNGGELAS